MIIRNTNDVSHLVRQIEVLGPVVDKARRVPGVVILEIHGVRPVGLRQDDSIFCCEVGGHSVDGLAGTDTGLVISVTIDISCAVRVFQVYGDLREHSSVRPFKLHIPIGQDIPVGVIRQGCAIDAGQLILPVGIGITEVRRLGRNILVIIDFRLGEDVSTGVIRVRFRESICGIRRLGQLTILVIAVVDHVAIVINDAVQQVLQRSAVDVVVGHFYVPVDTNFIQFSVVPVREAVNVEVFPNFAASIIIVIIGCLSKTICLRRKQYVQDDLSQLLCLQGRCTCRSQETTPF